jgi:predicted small lipoprotein YifL
MNMKNMGYLAVVLAVIMLVTLAGCSDKTTEPTPEPEVAAPPVETQPEEKPVELLAPPGETIELDFFDVDKKEVTVSAGATVTWLNKGTYAHIVQISGADKVPIVNSPRLETDGTFEYTFDDAGTYTWVGTTNPGLVRGTITVE